MSITDVFSLRSPSECRTVEGLVVLGAPLVLPNRSVPLKLFYGVMDVSSELVRTGDSVYPSSIRYVIDPIQPILSYPTPAAIIEASKKSLGTPIAFTAARQEQMGELLQLFGSSDGLTAELMVCAPSMYLSLHSDLLSGRMPNRVAPTVLTNRSGTGTGW